MLNRIAHKIKCLGMFGRTRFWFLYFASKLFNDKASEIEFIIRHLRRVPAYADVKLLDVGCCFSLLIYELKGRNYHVWGVDQQPYQEKLPRSFTFLRANACNMELANKMFDYVICVSVIEHVGTGDYGANREDTPGQVIKEIHRVLKDGGVLLLTTPHKYQTPAKEEGYTYLELLNLIKDLFVIQECEERKGTYLLCLVKI